MIQLSEAQRIHTERVQRAQARMQSGMGGPEGQDLPGGPLIALAGAFPWIVIVGCAVYAVTEAFKTCGQ